MPRDRRTKAGLLDAFNEQVEEIVGLRDAATEREELLRKSGDNLRVGAEAFGEIVEKKDAEIARLTGLVEDGDKEIAKLKLDRDKYKASAKSFINLVGQAQDEAGKDAETIRHLLNANGDLKCRANAQLLRARAAEAEVIGVLKSIDVAAHGMPEARK